MTEDEANKAFAMLDESDRIIVVDGILAAGAPEGVHEDEVVRQTGIVSDWIVKAEITTVLLAKMRAGEIRVTANAAGEPVFALVGA